MRLAMPAAAIAALLLAVPAASAQNCAMTSVGLVPLVDLGAGTWMGLAGGLYGGGSNLRPPAHDAAGLLAAAQVQPRDAAGAPDPAGRIVLLSLGMSNTTQEFSTWVPISNADPNRNPAVTVVDGAQGGQDAVDIADPGAAFWTIVDQRLAAAGVTPSQVQVAWLKEAVAGPTEPPLAHVTTLSGLLAQIVQVARARYPNLAICYLSSRTYAGYAVTGLNPEPYAYASGYAVQDVIQDQVAGDPAINFDPVNGPVTAPWLAWGPYLWTDGLVPRSDGLVWTCADVQPDGVHPSASGEAKVAMLLQQHFTTDATATPWYLDPNPGPPPAGVFPYGQGCPGTNGVPNILTNSAPSFGNPNFALGTNQNLPGVPATLFVSLAPDQLAVGSCTVLVDLAQLVLPAPGIPSTLVTGPFGQAVFHFAIPSDPALGGVHVFAQWAISDPQGALFPSLGGFALTRALDLRFGL